jgi:hypothetical protein
MSDDDVRVRRLGSDEAAERVEALADVLLDCVEGCASVGFMAPLSRSKAIAVWRDVEGVARGERVLLADHADSGRCHRRPPARRGSWPV